MQLVLPRSIRSPGTLWASAAPHAGGVWVCRVLESKPQASGSLNPCDIPTPCQAPVNQNHTNSLSHDLSDLPGGDLTSSFHLSHLHGHFISALVLSPTLFSDSSQTSSRCSVPSEKPFHLSAINLVEVYNMPAPARWDTAGSLSNGRAAGMIHAMPEPQLNLERSIRRNASV